MATGTLTGQTIANTYKALLKITGTDAGGTTLAADAVIVIEDGDGNPSSLSLSQQRATITLGSGAGDDFIVDGTTLVVEGDNNRVGIGTAAPEENLHVSGAGIVEIKVQSTDDDARFHAHAVDAQPALLTLTSGTDNSTDSFTIATHQTAKDLRFIPSQDPGDDPVVTILQDGKVGIGSQGSTLIGYADAAANNLVVGSSTGDEGITIISGASAGDYGALYFGDSNRGTNGRIMYEQNNEIMSFYTNNTEKMRIALNGNVGIGTTSPTGLIHVDAGTGWTNGDVFPFHFQNLAPSATNAYGMLVRAGGNDVNTPTFEVQDYGGNVDLSVRGNGKVGIGTASPTGGNLHIKTTSSFGTALMLENTSGGHGSILQFNNNSASPANADYLGAIFFSGDDAGGNSTTFGKIWGIAETVAEGNEDGAIAFETSANATSAEKMRITSAGYITAPSLNQTGSTSNRYPLYWVHTGTTGSIEPYTGSIRAMKTDIADMGTVDWIHSLTPRSFKFRDFEDIDGVRTYKDTTNDNPITEYGLIAEEVDEVSGSDYILDKNSDGELKGVLYHNLVPILLKSIQELSTANDALKSRIEALENA